MILSDEWNSIIRIIIFSVARLQTDVDSNSGFYRVPDSQRIYADDANG